MSLQVAPSVLISTTPPSHPPFSNANRCSNEIVNGPVPTLSTGDVTICWSGAEGLRSSTWPLLSGPKNTWRIGDSARRCHDAILGGATASPVTVQPWFGDSTVSVAEEPGTSL